jgi:hypothetical protein
VAPGPVSDWIYRIEKAGHGPLSWMEYHRSRMPTKSEAAELQIPVTIPVLEIVRVGRSALDDEPVEVTETVIPSDRVETVHELHRDESATWRPRLRGPPDFRDVPPKFRPALPRQSA